MLMKLVGDPLLSSFDDWIGSVSSYWCCCCIVRVLLIVCVLILEGLCTIRFMWYYVVSWLVILFFLLLIDLGRPLLSSSCWLDVIFYVFMLLITSVILFFLLLDLVRLLLSSSCWLDVIFYVVMLLKLAFVPLLSSFFFIVDSGFVGLKNRTASVWKCPSHIQSA